MSIAFLRSLLLTTTFSFLAPLLLIGGVLALLLLLTYVPLLSVIGNIGSERLLQFLTVFGSGSAPQGALTISLTCGLVGAMFDTYAFCRRQKPDNERC